MCLGLLLNCTFFGNSAMGNKMCIMPYNAICRPNITMLNCCMDVGKVSIQINKSSVWQNNFYVERFSSLSWFINLEIKYTCYINKEDI